MAEAQHTSLLPWLFGVPLLALAAAAATVHFLGWEQQAAMEEWTESRTREWEARDFRRPALWGETLPGKAFARYEAALRRAHELEGKDGDPLSTLAYHPDRIDAEAAPVLRARWAPVLDQVRAGAHREDARPSAVPTDGFAMRNVDMVAVWRVAAVARVMARERLAAGQGQEAVEILLDAATFGRDLMAGPGPLQTGMGSWVLHRTVGEAWPDQDLAQLGPAAREVLRAGLERLEAHLSTAPLGAEGAVLAMAHGFLGAGRDQNEEYSNWRDTWRWGFSARWMEAEAVTTMAAVCDDLRAFESRPWPERKACLEQHRLALRATHNPWIGDALIGERWREQTLAAIRGVRGRVR